MKYLADIGTWERGFVLDIEADSRQGALTQASNHLNHNYAEISAEYGEYARIVQIRDAESLQPIWDYWNGWLKGATS